MPTTRSRATEPSKVDEQGRTIIPKAVREALGIVGEKAYISYELDDGVVRIKKVRWSSE